MRERQDAKIDKFLHYYDEIKLIYQVTEGLRVYKDELAS